MWTTWICATMTGIKLAQLDPVSASFSRQLNGIGSGAHEFVTAEIGEGDTVEERRASRVDLTRTWARTVVQCWDDVPRYAGLIVGKTRKANGTVSINTVDVREVLKYRTTFGQNGYNGQTDGRFTLKNKTLTIIANYLIADATQQGLTANWSLPFQIPSRDGDGNQSREYHEFNLPVIETELSALQDTDGGPDIDFNPVWSASRLRWECRVGTLSGPTLDWDLNASKTSATEFGFVEDGNAQGNVFYAVGNGSDRDLKVATSAGLLQGDEPALERILQHTQERSLPVLQAHAQASLQAYQRPTRQYSLSMQADGEPGAGDLVLGQTLRTHTESDDWLPDGWLSHRLIGYSADLTTTIKLQMQQQ